MVADQLQALAAFAGGDSISLTSENDIPTGLASVREACDEVRRHRLSLLKRLEKDYRSAVTEIATLRDEIKHCRNSNGKLAAELQSARQVEQALRSQIGGKEIQIAAQSGRITELKQQSETLGEDLATTQVALGEQTQLRIKVQELVTKSQKELRALQKSSKVEREALEKLRTKTLISDQDTAELNVFRESWIAPFAAWNGTLGGLLGLLLVGGPGASLITTRLLGGKIGMAIGAGKDELASGVSQAISSLKETESAIETRVAELTNQQFEKTIQKVEETRALQEGASLQLEEISKANAGQLSGVSESVSASVGSLKELLTGTEQKILAGQTTVVESVKQAGSECQRDTRELKSVVESQHAAQVSGLREGTASISWQLQEAAKLANDRFEATRSTVEAGRGDVGNLRDALRQEVNDSSEETIRRIAEKSDSQLAPLKQLIQETRDDLGRQADQTQTFADEVRDSANRIGQQVDQLPMRLEAAGSQISTVVSQEMRQQLTSVQITVQSVRDQIDQVKHQFESGLHESERRQIESSGRTEQLSHELARLASLSDQIVVSIQSETAAVTSEVKDVTHGLSGALTRVDSQLQSVIREFDLLRNARPDNPTLTADVKCQLEQLQHAIKTLTAESRSHLSKPAFELESVSDTKTAASGETDLDDSPHRQPEPVEQTKTVQDGASPSGAKRHEIRELSMLPGLGEKSAEVLVAEGVNSIHELADLADHRKGVIEQRGGQFRRLDEWVAVARKVRMLHEKYDVPLKSAAGYAQSETWPEKLRHLTPEELQRLSSEFRGFANWLSESSDSETDLPEESEDA
ncbi:MAG: chromosome segregation ATPase [Planctomycetaceae bacterium]